MYEDAKLAAGKKAASLIEDGMIVGLGSGSTSLLFIESLVERCKAGLRIRAVSSSRASSDLAKRGGIEVLDINSISHIDLTVDGADQIDPQKRMIKGGGGAHVREKILAASSREMIVIVDESKLVKQLGKIKLPVEVHFYGSPATRSRLEALGFKSTWRMNHDQTLFITENGNLLLDIEFAKPIDQPEEVESEIKTVVGVIDTGFFFHLAGRVIVGHIDGTAKIIEY
jgi:ribose 5-phosphate isomerase A